jgi:hypothetical protein
VSDGLLVRGGEGGLAVSLAELATVSGLLGEAARSLGLAAAALRTAASRLGAGAELAPATGRRALASLERVVWRAAAVAGQVDELAQGARQARGVYERAEQTAVEVVDAAFAARWSLLPMPRLDDVLRPLGWATALDHRGHLALELSVAGGAARPAIRPSGAHDLLAGIDALYPGSCMACR